MFAKAKKHRVIALRPEGNHKRPKNRSLERCVNISHPYLSPTKPNVEFMKDQIFSLHYQGRKVHVFIHASIILEMKGLFKSNFYRNVFKYCV